VSHGHLGDRPKELAYAVKVVRELSMTLARSSADQFTQAEAIAILLDHIGELERMLTLIKDARESQARAWPAFAVHGVSKGI
jgi:hypothetical protein